MDSAERRAPRDNPASFAARTRPIRIAFVISGLGVGGAEMMLWKLLSRMNRTRFELIVVSLSSASDPMMPAYRRLGIRCESLAWRPRAGAATGFWRLVRTLVRLQPDIVQGWMYYGNLVATVACACLRQKVPVLWNVRATLMERRHEKRLTAAVIWLGGKLSFSPAKIINNSRASAAEHERTLGYRASKRLVLPNGFDTERFRPCPEARLALRDLLDLPAETPLIGMIARYHPMKDHRTFLQAAVLVSKAWPQAHFVLVGQHVEASNAHLASLIAECALSNRVHLLGQREDIQSISAALDIQVSASSSGEGFPNVIGEAMSCGVPCVVTDVGDSADVVGDTGVTVASCDPRAMAAGVERLLALDPQQRAELGRRARLRTIEEFSLDTVVRRYEELYLKVHHEKRST